MSVEENMLKLYGIAKEVLKDEKSVTIITEGRELHVFIPGATEFSISCLPGCKNVVVFHKVSVDPTRRSHGLGSYYHLIRLRIARKFGANLVLATVLQGNSMEKEILKKFGWSMAAQVSPNIEMWSKVL
jgi:GNAT superfamily N-acetyltransferase